MDPRMMALAQRMGAGSNQRPAPNFNNRNNDSGIRRQGLGASTSRGNSRVVNSGSPVSIEPGNARGPVPGVQGVTPGAVQRRMSGGPPPSMQLGQGGPGGPPGGMPQRPLVQNNPNQLGPARSQVSAPAGNIQQMIMALLQRGQQR